MGNDEQADTRNYIVVKNEELQFSIWLEGRTLPLGWVAVGKHGFKEECLAYIKQTWTDMRPATLREFLENKTK